MTEAELIEAIGQEQDPRKLLELAAEHWEGEVRREPNERERQFTKYSDQLDYWAFEVGNIESNRKIVEAISNADTLIPYRWRIAATETVIFAVDKDEKPQSVIMPSMAERKRVD